jgi:hypothetical protein
MHLRSSKFLAPLTIIAVTLLAAWGSLAMAAGARAGGKVHIYEADTNDAGNLGTIMVTGAITDHGTDHQGVAGDGKFNKLVLSKGSFEVDLGALGKKLGSIPVNPKTCASAGSATGQVPIVKGTGTGAYRGIRGTFETTATVVYIDPRLKNGKCNTSATHYPGVLMAIAAGTVSYK